MQGYKQCAWFIRKITSADSTHCSLESLAHGSKIKIGSVVYTDTFLQIRVFQHSEHFYAKHQIQAAGWIQLSSASLSTEETQQESNFTLHFLSCNQGKNLSQQAQGHTFFTVGCTSIMPETGITLCFIQEYSKGQTSMPQKVSISGILSVGTFSKGNSTLKLHNMDHFYPVPVIHYLTVQMHAIPILAPKLHDQSFQIQVNY